MAEESGSVYASANEMIAGVASETGVSAEDVSKVVRASFASIKDFVLQEVADAHAEVTGEKGEALSDEDLEDVAGGFGLMIRRSPGLRSFGKIYRSLEFGNRNRLLERFGNIGP